MTVDARDSEVDEAALRRQTPETILRAVRAKGASSYRCDGDPVIR